MAATEPPEDGPPPDGPPQVMVPIITLPVPQQVTWQPARDHEGKMGAHVLIGSPLTTTLLTLDNAGATALRDGLNEILAPGLTIAREMPPTNGQAPGPLGPFRA
jgi:hypothetical protein